MRCCSSAWGFLYELFFEDAKTASRELQITLTARDKERAIPMCGVPWHAAEGYISRLLRKGFRIAICEQLEDPKLTKKIVRRDVTRVLTPGTSIDSSLESSENNYLAAVHVATGTSAWLISTCRPETFEPKCPLAGDRNGPVRRRLAKLKSK